MNQPILWQCPHCGQPLQRQAAACVCTSGHNFDLAKEGYLNLLVGKQKPGHLGDSRDMLEARRHFFAGGFYEPLRQRLAQLVAGLPRGTVADIGCGEGYYVGEVARQLPDAMCLGTDIAKDGIKMAAKTYPTVQFAVADTNVGLPLADESVDVLLNIFAPRHGQEFARVLKPGGVVMVVIPTQRHLAELRDIGPLLSIQADKQRAVQDSLSSWLKLQQAETLTVPLLLTGQVITELVGMTPNARFMTDNQRANLAAVDEIKVTAEFEILVFKHV
jgi:23S rRNA (guanine745-N1)-methyltransferase